MALLEIAPRYDTLLRTHGLHTASHFLDRPGVIVGGHLGRHVIQVELGKGDATVRFFLKKETAIPWRDRFVSAWDGLGWASKSVREARLLTQLQAAGIGCPEPAAFGEEGGRAFLLVRAAEGMTDLRAYLAHKSRGADALAPASPREHVQRDGDADLRPLARALGGAVADIHRAGFDHPDLYAKHVLLARDGQGYRFCFLDWQRSRRSGSVSWRRRLRDLAALDASVAPHPASDRLRLRCLHAYLAAAGPDAPPLRRAAAAVRRAAQELLRRRKVREQRQAPLPDGAQRLLWLDDGRLCVTKEFHDEFAGRLPEPLTHLPGFTSAAEQVETIAVALAPGRLARFVRTLQTVGRGTPAAPEQDMGALLFRLQRFGVPAPRLLAMGHRFLGPTRRCGFALFETPPTTPFSAALDALDVARRRRLLRDAGRLLRQVHEAGYAFKDVPSPLCHLAVTDANDVTLAEVGGLRRSFLTCEQLALLELAREHAEAAAWTRTDRLRLTLGYLGRRRLDDEGRRLIATLAPPSRQAPERRVA